ncbi:MAG: hypothetical protein ABSC92_06555, partial [Rhizomicrobium sp.]
MPIEEVAMKSSRRDFFAVIGAGSALVMSNAGAAAAPVGAGSAPMPRTNNPMPGTATIRLPSVTDL